MIVLCVCIQEIVELYMETFCQKSNAKFIPHCLGMSFALKFSSIKSRITPPLAIINKHSKNQYKMSRLKNEWSFLFRKLFWVSFCSEPPLVLSARVIKSLLIILCFFLCQHSGREVGNIPVGRMVTSLWEMRWRSLLYVYLLCSKYLGLNV